jgi:hypothetical protein
MAEQIVMKRIYIIAPEPISTVYFVCLYAYFPLVERQRLTKNVTAATNTRATVEELFDA